MPKLLENIPNNVYHSLTIPHMQPPNFTQKDQLRCIIMHKLNIVHIYDNMLSNQLLKNLKMLQMALQMYIMLSAITKRQADNRNFSQFKVQDHFFLLFFFF